MAPNDISGPTPWPEQIANAIDECDVMLIVVSANANESTHRRSPRSTSDYHVRAAHEWALHACQYEGLMVRCMRYRASKHI